MNFWVDRLVQSMNKPDIYLRYQMFFPKATNRSETACYNKTTSFGYEFDKSGLLRHYLVQYIAHLRRYVNNAYTANCRRAIVMKTGMNCFKII